MSLSLIANSALGCSRIMTSLRLLEIVCLLPRLSKKPAGYCSMIAAEAVHEETGGRLEQCFLGPIANDVNNGQPNWGSAKVYHQSHDTNATRDQNNTFDEQLNPSYPTLTSQLQLRRIHRALNRRVPARSARCSPVKASLWTRVARLCRIHRSLPRTPTALASRLTMARHLDTVSVLLVPRYIPWARTMAQKQAFEP